MTRAGRHVRWARSVALAAVGLAAVLGLTADAAGPGAGLWLRVWDLSAQRVVLDRPVRAEDRIRLEHTYSVTERPVLEILSVDESGQLAMEEMRFDTFGANLPVGPEHINGVTTTFLRVEDGYRVLHHGRLLGTVQLMTGGPEVDHTLTLPGGERVRLLDLVDRGTRVALTVRGGTGGT